MQKQIAILGSGTTGLSVANFLRSKKIDFDVFDSRTESPNAALFQNEYQQQVICGDFDFDRLKLYKKIVVSPGIVNSSLNSIADKLIGDIELFAQYCSKPIIAITGSNGKSTATSLVACILEDYGYKIAAGGNLDVGYRSDWAKPALRLLDIAADYYILELSSYQLQYCPSLKAKVAAIINISADHLDYHKNFDNYLQAKLNIFNNAQVAVYNYWQPNLKPTAEQNVGDVVAFGNAENINQQWGLIEQDDCFYIGKGFKTIIKLDDLPDSVTVHPQNICAALAITGAIGIDHDKAIKAMQAYTGLPHRAEIVTTSNKQIKVINDSKATNVAATISVLKTIKSSTVLLLGGQAKSQKFYELKQYCLKCCKLIIIFGEDAKLIAKHLGTKLRLQIVQTLEQAIIVAKKNLAANETLLLSPACASFDQFKNYRHRGDAFKQLVTKQFDEY